MLLLPCKKPCAHIACSVEVDLERGGLRAELCLSTPHNTGTKCLCVFMLLQLCVCFFSYTKFCH